MIHLKPLTHHGLQTHKPHKQGYLKWHYHPNTQDTNANQATQTYQHIKDHEPRHTTQWDNNQLYTFPEELLNQPEDPELNTQQQEIQQLLEEMENDRPKVNQALKTLGLNIQLQPLTLLQDDRPHATKHKELKEFIQKSAETSRLNRETYMKKSQEIQDRIDKHRRRAKEYLSQLP